MPSSSFEGFVEMGAESHERLTDEELVAFFDRLFPHGFAGRDVLDEIAPLGWERSPLLACFHPSLDRLLEERIRFHRNLEELRRISQRRGNETDAATNERTPEPTIDDVRRDCPPTPINRDEEVTELVGLCLWDIFSDNHDVIAPDGRVADIGSFRGAGAFLDEYLNRHVERSWREADYMRFYMGTIWIYQRADLAPVYSMIFRRLRSIGGDWVYHFPELRILDLGGAPTTTEEPARYSPSEGAAADLEQRKRDAEGARFRTELADANLRAREDAMDRPPPATVHAYRGVFGRDPRGWPPA